LADLSQAKLLGGIGSILIFIPFISIIGYVLLIVAVKDISDFLGDRTIFNNIVVAAVAGIIGAVAGGVVVVIGVLLSGATFGISNFASLGVGLVIAWITLVVSAFFLRRAYDSIASGLSVGTFRTAATLYLVGAVLTVVFVGFIILFVAEIVQAVAYFSIPEEIPPHKLGGSSTISSTMSSPPAPPMTTTMTAPTVAASAAEKFCTSCGTRLSPTATFCYSCGAKQQS
jgi:uncharacterized membrane protein/ribosomal protein L40E